MSKTLDQEKMTSVFAMHKGEPGTRKSTQALTYPLPHYWFSQDGKMNSLLLPGKKWGIDFKQVEYDAFKTWTEMEKKVEQLQVKCKYKTLIVDSITTVGDTVNFEVMNQKTGGSTKTGDAKGKTIGGIRVNSIEDYNAQASAFTSMLARFKDLREYYNVNIVLIAHVVGERKTSEESVTSASRVIVTGGKAISGKIPAYCDEIYHFDIRKAGAEGAAPDFQIFTVPTGFDFARTALPLPGTFKLGDKQLWKDYVEPAMLELNK